MTWTDGAGSPSSIEENLSNNYPDSDSYPDVSPDVTKIVFSSVRSNDYLIITRQINDVTGNTEQILIQSTAKKIWPRWSCKQELIAYSEYASGNGPASIYAVRAYGSGTPIQITFPGPGESDNRGHDFFDNDEKIVFSRRNPSTNSYDLYVTSSDGSGTLQQITNTSSLNEILPVVSHDGSLIAYVGYVMLAPGWMEVVTIVDAETWMTLHTFQLQPPVGGRRIGAIAFSRDDEKLYVGTKSADVTATPESKKYELYSVRLDGSDSKRLTNNQWFDSYPDAIPEGPVLTCTPVCLAPPVGMVSWWPGDDHANDIVDGNHGTLEGNATFAPGVVGQGFSLDGDGDYVLVPDSGNLNITGDVTVDLWAKRTDLVEGVLVAKGDLSGTIGTLGKSAVFMLSFDIVNRLHTGFFTSNGGSFGVGNPLIDDFNFHHYAYVRQGTLNQVYLDGVKVAEGHVSSNLIGGPMPGDTTGDPLVIGAFQGDQDPSGFVSHFAGIIDEVEVFDRALSDEEILSIYNAGAAGKCKP
jgi:hypothetical protein